MAIGKLFRAASRNLKRTKPYPVTRPNRAGYIDVSDGHKIYVEEAGNPNGVPIVLLHGGPGQGSNPGSRQYYDPKHYRIIQFDQRGAGKSKPSFELKGNTTENLIADMEVIRKKLGVDQWHIEGGSWGSTLALAYAEEHPENCLSLTIQAVCAFRQSEIDWFWDGIKKYKPDAHQELIEFLPPEERDTPMESYYRRVTSPDRKTREDAALAWARFEMKCALEDPQQLKMMDQYLKQPNARTMVMGLGRLEIHYMRNQTFAPDDKIIRDLHKIGDVPVTLIQGDADRITPDHTARLIHSKLKNSDYISIPGGSHSGSEPGFAAAKVQTSEKYKSIRPSRRTAAPKPKQAAP